MEIFFEAKIKREKEVPCKIADSELYLFPCERRLDDLPWRDVNIPILGEVPDGFQFLQNGRNRLVRQLLLAFVVHGRFHDLHTSFSTSTCVYGRRPIHHDSSPPENLDYRSLLGNSNNNKKTEEATHFTSLYVEVEVGLFKRPCVWRDGWRARNLNPVLIGTRNIGTKKNEK